MQWSFGFTPSLNITDETLVIRSLAGAVIPSPPGLIMAIKKKVSETAKLLSNMAKLF